MSSKNNPALNLVFKIVERAGFQAISLIVTIVLARIIDVKDYGAIELILVLVSLCQVFVQTGLNSALIQKKDAEAMDFSAAFYLNVSVALLLYLFLFFLAPFIEDFYEIKDFGNYLRVCALIILPASYNSIQNAYIAKNLMFNKQMICCILAVSLSGGIGIILVYQGFGVWAYIAYQIASAIFTPLFSKSFVNWRPGRIDSYRRVIPIYKFGIKVLGANLLETLYNDISSLIIGKKYSSSDLAYYGKGKQFPQAIINIFNGSLSTVAFPYFSTAQDNVLKIKQMSRITIRASTFIAFPAMFGLAGIANTLIRFLLTEKWLTAAPYLQLMCVTYLVMPIYTTNVQAMNAIGRSDIHLKVETIKKLISILALAVSIIFFQSVYAIIIGQIVVIPITVFISMYPSQKILGYKITELIKDIVFPLTTSTIMYVTIHLIDSIKMYTFFKLIIEISVGLILYLGINAITCNENYSIAKSYLYKMTKKNQG